MKCETCRWWDKPDEDVTGLCRVNPPDAVCGWPSTESNDWCASWAGGRKSWRGEPAEVLDKPHLYEGDESD